MQVEVIGLGAMGSAMANNLLKDAPIYKTYGGLIAEERYHPAGFKAELGYKDIRLAIAAAEALKVPMPLASLIATRRLALIAQGGSHLD
ncbi:MAG: NAD-binding protein, partial [Methyloceanibacter sp.]